MQKEPVGHTFDVDSAAPPVVTVRELAAYAPARLHAGVTASAPSVVAARLHAGLTVMEPGVPVANMHVGVTVMPTGMPVTTQVAVQEAVPLMAKEPAVGEQAYTGPVTNAERLVGFAPPHPLIEKLLVEPCPNHTGAPAVIVPTAA